MKNIKLSMMVIATSGYGLLLSGCNTGEETVVVQPPAKVVEKTTIKEVPEEKPKTIIVKPAPRPAAKVENETNVKVVVAPTPKPKPIPSKLPEPAAQPTLRPKAESSPQAAPKPRVAPTPRTADARPVPTATPRPRVAATPKKSSSGGLVVRAEVIETSKAPDPKTVPYKDALIFTKYKVLGVENGQYQEKEILVAQWAMKDKKLLPAARNRVGQVQTLSLEPLSKRGELDSVMRSDDTNEFELEPYFAK